MCHGRVTFLLVILVRMWDLRQSASVGQNVRFFNGWYMPLPGDIPCMKFLLCGIYVECLQLCLFLILLSPPHACWVIFKLTIPTD